MYVFTFLILATNTTDIQLSHDWVFVNRAIAGIFS